MRNIKRKIIINCLCTIVLCSLYIIFSSTNAFADCPSPCKLVPCQYVGQWETSVDVKNCKDVPRKVHPIIAGLFYEICKDVTAVYAERDLYNHDTCVGPNAKPKMQPVVVKVEKYDCSGCGGMKYNKQITKRVNILVWPQDCFTCQYIIVNAKWYDPERYSTSYKTLVLNWEGEF